MSNVSGREADIDTYLHTMKNGYESRGYSARGTQNVPNHDDLHVSEEQFVEFADAITAFWKAVPENCYYSDLKEEAKWLSKVVTKFEKKQKENRG